MVAGGEWYPNLSRLPLRSEPTGDIPPLTDESSDDETNEGQGPVPDLEFDQKLIKSIEYPPANDFLTEGRLVRVVPIIPRPAGAKKPYDVWAATLECLGWFVLDNSVELTESRFETHLRNLLTLPPARELGYNEAVTFLGHYLALSFITMYSTGLRGGHTWGGAITDENQYPYKRAIQIWNEIVRKGRSDTILKVLLTVCPDIPVHPFLFTGDEASPFWDTLCGVVSMVVEAESTDFGYDRDLIISSMNTQFMGHVFVTRARHTCNDIKAMVPFGICRSAFFLPGTCVKVEDSSGFVGRTFEVIEGIARKNNITHAFTWPLPKMKARFLKMGWDLIRSKDTTNTNYKKLKTAVQSIYGMGRRTKNILENQFSHFDFVFKAMV
jgi:hypothetical protein